MRGEANVLKTSCKHGHPLSGANLYQRSDGARECLACKRISRKVRYLSVEKSGPKTIKPLPKLIPPQLMAKVQVTDSCWIYRGSILGGYGRTTWGGKAYKAHRFFYQVLRGPIPDGFSLDHLCTDRACVNPDHLEPVTSRENTRRKSLRKTS